jgi:hypothetical protein
VLHVAVEQCGRLEKLQKFEGNKRSCRESLISRREQRLHHQQSQLPPGQLEHEWSDSEEDISGHLQHDITCHVQLEQQHTVLLGNSSPASKWLPVADGPEGIPGCDDMAELPMDHMQTQQLLDQKPQELLPGLLQQQPQQLDQQLSGLAGAGLLPAASSQQQQQQQLPVNSLIDECDSLLDDMATAILENATINPKQIEELHVRLEQKQLLKYQQQWLQQAEQSQQSVDKQASIKVQRHASMADAAPLRPLQARGTGIFSELTPTSPQAVPKTTSGPSGTGGSSGCRNQLQTMDFSGSVFQEEGLVTAPAAAQSASPNSSKVKSRAPCSLQGYARGPQRTTPPDGPTQLQLLSSQDLTDFAPSAPSFMSHAGTGCAMLSTPQLGGNPAEAAALAGPPLGWSLRPPCWCLACMATSQKALMNRVTASEQTLEEAASAELQTILKECLMPAALPQPAGQAFADVAAASAAGPHGHVLQCLSAPPATALAAVPMTRGPSHKIQRPWPQQSSECTFRPTRTSADGQQVGAVVQQPCLSDTSVQCGALVNQDQAMCMLKLKMIQRQLTAVGQQLQNVLLAGNLTNL